jgi:hypothetical protein
MASVAPCRCFYGACFGRSFISHISRGACINRAFEFLRRRGIFRLTYWIHPEGVSGHDNL